MSNEAVNALTVAMNDVNAKVLKGDDCSDDITAMYEQLKAVNKSLIRTHITECGASAYSDTLTTTSGAAAFIRLALAENVISLQIVENDKTGLYSVSCKERYITAAQIKAAGYDISAFFGPIYNKYGTEYNVSNRFIFRWLTDNGFTTDNMSGTKSLICTVLHSTAKYHSKDNTTAFNVKLDDVIKALYPVIVGIVRGAEFETAEAAAIVSHCAELAEDATAEAAARRAEAESKKAD